MKTSTTRGIRFIVSSLAILLLSGFVATAQAQGPGGQGRFGDFEQRFEKMAEQLDLTADQTQAIKKIREAGRAEGQKIHKQIMRLQNEKRGELLKDEPDAKTAISLAKEIGSLRTDLRVNRLENRLAVRKMLTTEQRDKMLRFGARHGRRAGVDRHGPAGCNGDNGGRPQRRSCGGSNGSHGHGHNQGNW